MLRKCEIFADANVGKFHFTSTEAVGDGRYFTIHAVNYFTFGNAEYFTRKTPQLVADDIHAFGVIEMRDCVNFLNCFAKYDIIHLKK